jgi:hypothetical protein
MIRYYPSFATKNNQITKGNEFFLEAEPYSGKFYYDYKGDAYTGVDSVHGSNLFLTPINSIKNKVLSMNTRDLSSFEIEAQQNTRIQEFSSRGLEPTTYYPQPIDSDYQKGYITRYFAKKINQSGYVVEISPAEYVAFTNGEVMYDISFYQVVSILWKITGPLNTQRISQYDIRAGIIDTNKRLTEAAEPNFVGIDAFIGGDYTKFAKPTS